MALEVAQGDARYYAEVPRTRRLKVRVRGGVNDKLFFTGYAGGSSVGVAQALGCYMLLQTEKHCLQVPEVQAWLKSLTSIKVNFVVHEDSFSRLFDSIGSRS